MFVTDPIGGAPQGFLNADARGGTAGGKTSYTVSQAGNQIIGGEPGWSAALGLPFTVTYGFRATAPATMPDDTTGFVRFNAAQIVQAELALTAWSDVANITFTRVGVGTSGEAAYTDNATMLLANYTSGPASTAAFAFYPGSTAVDSRAGDLWVDYTDSYNQSPLVGNYGGLVLIHELGHTIGLGHPGDYGAEDDPTYAANAAYYEDTRQYTVMSYFSESNTGGYFAGRYPAAPMLDDISAAQQEYGANMTTRLGDTVYGFNSTAGRPWFEITSSFARAVFAVWDAGGNDTLDFSGYGDNQLIDLRQGFFSNVGGLTGNVAVAMGANIENAKGGSGSDVINGNALFNTIFGGAGNDTVDGGAGQSYLRGDEGNDSLRGGAAFDDINGNMGNDTAYGGAGSDWVVGGKDNDQLYGEDAFDIVYGNLGADTCYGGDGDDWVRGGQENDTLSGGSGNDFMSGDRGDDTLAGDAGADRFNFFVGAGLDRVVDFNRAAGDYVTIEGGGAYTASQAGADTVVSLGPGDQMVLVGVQLSSLGNGWIVAV